MRKLTFILLIIPFYLASASKLDITLSEVTDNLSEPWGMSFIDDEKLLITEKTGAITVSYTHLTLPTKVTV